MTTIKGIPMQTRPGVYDAEICAEVATQYYQDRIDYAALKTVVDIGAHIGAFTALVKGTAPACRVVAVEMMHDNYTLLSANVAPLEGVTAVYAQMWYGRDDLHAYRNVGNYGACGLLSTDIHQQDIETCEVSDVRLTLEELCDLYDIGSADVLKLDCEGSEWNILEHAKPETLRRFKHIVGEWHLWGGAGGFRALCETLTDFEIMDIENVPGWGQFWLRRKD